MKETWGNEVILFGCVLWQRALLRTCAGQQAFLPQLEWTGSLNPYKLQAWI